MALQQGCLFFESIFLSSSFPIIRTTHISHTKIYLASPSLANCSESSAVFRAESINLEISTMMSLPERFAPFCLPHRWLSFSLSPLSSTHNHNGSKRMILLSGCPSILLFSPPALLSKNILLFASSIVIVCMTPLWFLLALSKGRFTKALFPRILRRTLHPHGTDFCSNQFLFLFSLEVAQNKFYLGNWNNWKQQGKCKASWQRN